MSNKNDQSHNSKQQMREKTTRLLHLLKTEYSLTQKEISTNVGVTQTDLSKAKNTDPETLNEISKERWRSINSKLEAFAQKIVSQNNATNFLPDKPHEEFGVSIPTHLSLEERPIKAYTHKNNQENGEHLELHKNLKYFNSNNNLKEFLLYSCCISGLIAFLSIVLMKDYLGYSNIAKKPFFQVIPLLFISHILIGGLIGWTAYKAIASFIKKKQQFVLKKYSLILFFGVFILRGIKSRDSYFLCESTGEPCNGLLGQPNFELLATSIAFSICGFGIMKYSTTTKIFNYQRALKNATYYSIISTISFSLTNEFYKLMVYSNIIEDKGSIISSAIFRFSFSHPERVPWIFLFSFAALFLSAVGINKIATERKGSDLPLNNRPPLSVADKRDWD